MSTTWDDEAALAHREELRDDAVNRLRMLRHTITERVDRLQDEIDRTDDVVDVRVLLARLRTYRTVRALIGPEYDLLADDDEQPF